LLDCSENLADYRQRQLIVAYPCSLRRKCRQVAHAPVLIPQYEPPTRQCPIAARPHHVSPRSKVNGTQRIPQRLEQLLKAPPPCLRIKALLHQNIEYVATLADGPPEVDQLGINLAQDFIEVPRISSAIGPRKNLLAYASPNFGHLSRIALRGTCTLSLSIISFGCCECSE
jgi:hypothetical protein